MSKKILLALVLVVLSLLVGGGIIYARSRVTNAPSSSQPQSIENIQPKPQEPQERTGVYEDYDVTKLSQAQDGKVVLFFMARWSKTSKNLDATLKSKDANIPNNFTILLVDYDKNYQLRKKYEVPFENTFVQVDVSGNMINRWSGSEDPAEIYALAR